MTCSGGGSEGDIFVVVEIQDAKVRYVSPPTKAR